MKILFPSISPINTLKRLKGYKWLLLGQTLVIIHFLFIFELCERYPFPYWQLTVTVSIGLIMILMNILTYWLIRELTKNRYIQYGILSLLWLSIISSLITPIELIASNTSLLKTTLMLGFIFSLLSFITLLFYMLIDIFKEKHSISYRLWGSACIYLLFGSVFGILYSLFSIILPNEFLIDAPLDMFYIIPAYNLSFYTLSGIDSPFENFSMLVKNLTVIEAIFSNLFIVLVVGRLLAK